MAYYLADSNGYLQDFASIGGMREFSTWAAGKGGSVAKLCREGVLDDPKGLLEQLTGVDGSANVREMSVELKAAAEKADGPLIISDGSDSEFTGPEPSVLMRALFSEEQARDEHGRWTVQGTNADSTSQISKHGSYFAAVQYADRAADRTQREHSVHSPQGKRVYTAQPGQSLFGDVHPNPEPVEKAFKDRDAKKQKGPRNKESQPSLFQAAMRALKDNVLVGMNFKTSSKKAQKWASDHAAELVEGVSKSTREAIRGEVESAFEEQFDVDELADRITDLVGDDARADRIARTETMKASNYGQQDAWDQAVDEGVLSGDEKKEWIATPDESVCPICDGLDGEQVELGDTFDVGDDEVDGPPAHPNCRCTMGLVG